MSEEINRAIHEKVIGECWHEGNPKSREIGLRWVPCVKCHENIRAWDDEPNPDYCTDLNAVAKAEAKVIEKVGFYPYKNALIEACDFDAFLITATAEQRAKAILKALEIEE